MKKTILKTIYKTKFKMNKAKDIQEGNKLIAEFTERAIQEDRQTENRYWIILPGKELGQWVRESHLKYHSSWDWLMPVVEKIAEEHSLFSLVIGNVNCYAQFEDTPVRKGVEPKPIDAVWKHVVKFITWYNQNKTS